MLDMKFIRENPDLVKQAITNKREKADVDKLLELDSQRRANLQEVEQLKAERNKASQSIAKLKREGKDAGAAIAKTQETGNRIKELDERVKAIEQDLNELLSWVPNVPHESVPVGQSEQDNTLVRNWGVPKTFDFDVQPHWDIAEQLDIVDFAAGANLAGSSFVSYKGAGARLERALINFMLDLHTKEHGHIEIAPPAIANRQTMFSTGQIPKLADDMYRIEEDDLYLIPTGEVPVTNLHRDQQLKEKDLPLYYTAYTPCFRREAGAHGKDTRGLVRLHQFDKVEMVRFVKPENSYEELERLLQHAEKVLQLLDLPYRVLELCTADLSFAAAKCYDIEVWAPGVQKWLEVSSCSNFEAFQALRGNIRYRKDDTGKLEHVHTLNGSGLALPRTVIAILENYQTEDGKINIPDALQSHFGAAQII